MNWVNMHVLSGLWARIDEFGMILCMEHDWMVGWILAWDLVCMIILCLVGETWLWYGSRRNSMNLLVISHGGVLC